MSSYQAYPVVEQNGAWSVPDDVLRGIWRRMVAEDRARITFYDAGVLNEEDFLTFVKSPFNLPVLVIDPEKDEIVMIAWLNGLENSAAKCHFCVLGPYHRGIAETAVAFWDRFRRPDGTPLFKVLIGITPETYEAAIKMLKLAGYTVLGTVPYMCYLRHEGKLVGGTISYHCPEGG